MDAARIGANPCKRVAIAWPVTDRDEVAVTDLSRYQFRVLREDSEFALFRGERAGDAPILMLAPVTERPAPASLARLEHECSLAAELDPAWSARPQTLARHQGRILVLADPGGDPIGKTVGRPLELTRFLQLAVSLTAALGEVHRRGLVHKDIKPASYVGRAAHFMHR
jgi:hypothetical protein